MEHTWRLALTGTPGTGKTTIAAMLEKKGIGIDSVESLAERHGCIGEVDIIDGARPVDLGALSVCLQDEWRDSPESTTVIDGHLSHNLPVDGVIILRCSPEELRVRLDERGYSDLKSTENIEWEFIGGAWNEREGHLPWVEFDTSADSVECIVATLHDWISDGLKPMSPRSAIDWVSVQEG